MTPGERQLPLALRYPPDQRLDTFVGASAGVLEQLRAWAEGRSRDRLYLSGPAGAGKTHLALATCVAAEAAGQHAIYLPLRATVRRLGVALDAIDGPVVVVLDGVEAIAGDREDEIALFDAHNRLGNAGAAILYTAQAAPEALPLVLPDLRSRLAQCTRLQLTPLDDMGRRTVLVERARRRGLVLEEAALDWLFARVGRDLTGLTAILDQLDRASLAAQRRITVPFLRQVLASG